jgi:hypothetical protein
VTVCGSCKKWRFGRMFVSIIRVLRIGCYHLLMFIAPWWWKQYVPLLLLLQEPHGVTSQKTAFSIVATVKISNLTLFFFFFFFFFCRFGRTPWQVRIVVSRRGYVWVHKKYGTFWDSVQNILRISQAPHSSIYFCPITYNSKLCIHSKATKNFAKVSWN